MKLFLSYFSADGTCLTENDDQEDVSVNGANLLAEKITAFAWANSTQDIVYECRVSSNEIGNATIYSRSIDVIIALATNMPKYSEIFIFELKDWAEQDLNGDIYLRTEIQEQHL